MFIHSLTTYSSEHWIGPLCLESSLNCWWYKFNKTASNIIHIFCPIKTLSQNVIIFQGYPMDRNWFEYSELIAMLKKRGDFSFVPWCIIILQKVGTLWP